MVTNSKDYEELLWQIQSNAPTEKAILLPKNEKIYDIDLNTRKISVPKFLSVAKDHYAETIYFKFDRYFDYTDLTTKACIIRFTNAAGNSYIYPVPYYDTQTLAYENKVLIPWCIQGAATEKAGIVKFAICWFSTNEKKEISYSFNTLVAEGTILQGQNNIDDPSLTSDQIVLSPELMQMIEKLEDDYNKGTFTLYWLDV